MPYHLDRSLFIPNPRAKLFAFFADAANLERITPAFLHFHILTPSPIAMHAGTLIDYQLRLFGIPFHWRTKIETFDPPTSFTDIQLTGPYRRWHHRHEFLELPGGTEMRDHVEYDLPLGPIGAIARTLFVRRAVDQIFDHRNATITRIFTRSESQQFGTGP
jgi:ligand-binding SRPBCC domain-containing protein